jgi:signal transduction histidine kinase
VSQVIVNLISNSVKFTQAGEIKVIVQWKPTIRTLDSSKSLNMWFSTDSIREHTELSVVETSGVQLSLDCIDETDSPSSGMEITIEIPQPALELRATPKCEKTKPPSANHPDNKN